MGLFRDMKDMVQTVRSDELKELKKKTAAQPRISMLEGVKMANEAYAFGSVYSSGLEGTATVNAIGETGLIMNESPVCELDLTVSVAGREPYQVKHRQLIAHSALARFQPGSTFSVRVDQNDPAKLVIG